MVEFNDGIINSTWGTKGYEGLRRATKGYVVINGYKGGISLVWFSINLVGI